MRNKTNSTMILAVCCAIVLILDSKNAFFGASKGIELCVKSVIPSLFPFFFISAILIDILQNKTIFKRNRKFLNIPQEYISFLLLGCISGYPVGAKNVQQAYREKQLYKEDAERLIALCNNAGPAFIFGMLSHVFQSKTALWCIWGTQILSSLIVANFTVLHGDNNTSKEQAETIGLTDALKTATSAIASVCGWVVLFKTFLYILKQRLLYRFPSAIVIIISGFCELANGCVDLSLVNCEPLQYLLCTAFLSFGGLCVTLQTASVVAPLSLRHYVPVKIIQCIIAVIIAYISLPFLYPHAENRFYSVPSAILIAIITFFVLLVHKKTVAFLENMLYNREKSDMRGLPYDF